MPKAAAHVSSNPSSFPEVLLFSPKGADTESSSAAPAPNHFHSVLLQPLQNESPKEEIQENAEGDDK